MDTLSFSWPDILAIGISFAATALTFIAIVAALIIFFLGIRYSKHLTEVEVARKELLELTNTLKKDIRKNSLVIEEVHLGLSIVGDLVSLHDRQKKIQNLSCQNISPDKLQEEENKIRREMDARSTELRIILSNGSKCKASMVGLSQTIGDEKSIQFLEKYADVLASKDIENIHFYKTLQEIRARLDTE